MRIHPPVLLGLLFLTGCAGSAPSAIPPVVPPPVTVAHSVALDWDAAGGSDVYLGYLVYRGAGVSGPWVKLTPAPINRLDFDDVTVAAGQHYAYYVSSVDTADQESVPSNIVTAQVPSP